MLALDKLMELLEVSTIDALAVKLGYANAERIYMWRRRKKIPMKEIRAWAIKFEKPVRWFTGEDEMKDADMNDFLDKLVGIGKLVDKDKRSDVLKNVAALLIDEHKP